MIKDPTKNSGKHRSDETEECQVTATSCGPSRDDIKHHVVFASVADLTKVRTTE